MEINVDKPLRDSDVTEDAQEIVDPWRDPRTRLRTTYHEAAHFLTYQKHGITPEYVGPLLTLCKGELFQYFGGVSVPT